MLGQPLCSSCVVFAGVTALKKNILCSVSNPLTLTLQHTNNQHTNNQHTNKPINQLHRRVKMTRLRLRVAERLKGAQNTYAMLTTFNEVDMTGLMEMRNTFKVGVCVKHQKSQHNLVGNKVKSVLNIKHCCEQALLQTCV